MEYSLFMIKPCAYEKKEEILKIINQKLKIVYTRNIILNEEFLNKLYRHEKNEVYKAINTDQLTEKKACIGIGSGENAIQDLIDICGDKPLGTLCEENSIRYKFAPKEEIMHIGEQIFFVNSIHKAAPEEALYQVTLFIKEFLSDEFNKNNIAENEIEDDR